MERKLKKDIKVAHNNIHLRYLLSNCLNALIINYSRVKECWEENICTLYYNINYITSILQLHVDIQGLSRHTSVFNIKH